MTFTPEEFDLLDGLLIQDIDSLSECLAFDDPDPWGRDPAKQIMECETLRAKLRTMRIEQDQVKEK